MKGIDYIFCKSQSSTSTLTGGTTKTMEEGSSSSSIKLGRGPTIDRYNPIIRDSNRLSNTLPPPPYSITIDQKQNTKTTTNKKKKKQKNVDAAAKTNDDKNGEGTILNWGRKRRSWSCMNPGGFITPPGSSRYLLTEKTFNNVLPHTDTIPADNSSKSHASITQEEEDSGDSTQFSFAPPPCQLLSSGLKCCGLNGEQQVVVLRVSLHCRGCERKMRKHISTMEWVSSFNIDFMAKKVTVEGNVTPLEVLASISKVKNAQLWTSPPPPDFGYTNTF